jgi:hypothetical protein
MFAEKERICNEENERYVHAYSKVLEELNKSVSDVIGMSDSILNLEILHDKDTRSELLNKLQEVYASLDKIKEGIGKGRIIRTFSRYYKASAEINYSTSRYVKRERTKLEKLVDEIIIGKFNLNEISMSDKCRHTIDSYIKALNDIEEKRKEKYAAINGLKDKYLIHYWNEHLRDLIITIRREHPELIPEEVKRHISANIGDLQEKHDELVHYLEIRNQLYDFYNKAYNRYFKESTL